MCDKNTNLKLFIPWQVSLPCDEAPPNLQPEILCFKFQCQFGNAKTIELLHFMFNCAGNMCITDICHGLTDGVRGEKICHMEKFQIPEHEICGEF